MSSPFSENPYQTPRRRWSRRPIIRLLSVRPYCTEAIAALVCSLVGMLVCGILLEPVALICPSSP